MSVKEKLKARKRESVFVPDWDTTVFVKSLSAIERMELADKLKGKSEDTPKERVYHLAALLMYAVVNDLGERLLTEDDIPDLIEQGDVFALLGNRAMPLNGLTEEKIATAKND